MSNENIPTSSFAPTKDEVSKEDWEKLTLRDKLWGTTKKVHRRALKFRELKAAIALANHQIYRTVLKDFYYVFKTFEEIWEEEKANSTVLSDAYMPELLRTRNIEKDLEFYYGKDWLRAVYRTPIVRDYENHIREVAKTRPEVLIAYGYAFYLGIFAGGQIMRSKITRSAGKFFKFAANQVTDPFFDGLQVFFFRDSKTMEPLELAKLRKDYIEKINSLEVDAELENMLIDELLEIHRRNDLIIGSIKGTELVIAQWVCYFISLLVVFIYAKRIFF
ncbi:heme oxygenase [Basidiobolus ranarum]|uniref:Heme oxygenase n=1 Tax=Basidiobolus ranarum TaxID=34480 RepID=A0ABR2WVC1_9FUNG